MTQMTISQAIREVANLKGKIKDWTSRMQDAVFFLDENPAAFQFSQVREARNQCVERMVALSTAISVANATTVIDFQGKKIPLALAIRTLSEIKGLIDHVKTLPVRNQEKGVDVEKDYEYGEDGRRHPTRTEKPWTCTLPTAKKVELIDQLQARFNKLNDVVEATNGKTLIGEVVGLSDASL